MPRFVIALAGALLPALASAADDSDVRLAQTARDVLRDLRIVRLENGLRIYLLPVPDSPLVSVMTAYRVGSADEEKDQTGLSHYLEHLLFKGTDKLFPGDIDRLTQRNGGQNNAYTTEDMTVYHFDFAADRWQVALEIEADRMRNVRIDEKHEFEQEKGAVIAELNRNEDLPGDLEYKAVLRLLWPPDSPYSHPVIGEAEHVRAATAEIIKRYYDQWYHPNNAALVVVGGFDPDAALARIRKLFGPIPAAELPPRKTPTYFRDRAGPVRKEFPSKFELPRMLMGFNTVAAGTPEDVVLDVIQSVLAGGRTSRLYRKLVEEERVALNVEAGNYAGRYPGWFAISLDLLKDKDRARAEEMVFAELERLAAEPVTDAELKRARRKILARLVYGSESVHGLADFIARTSAYPVGEDVTRYLNDYLDRLLAVTPADVQRVAKEFFARRKACVVWSVPPKDPPPGEKGQGSGRGSSAGRGERVSGRPHLRRAVLGRGEPVGGGGGRLNLTDARRTVLPNGLTVITLENHRLPIVVVSAEVADVTLREPANQAGVAALTGALLDEGTASRTGRQIATLAEDAGLSLSFSRRGGSLITLSPDLELGLDLFFDCLTRPAFPPAEFERQKEQQLAAIDDEATQPAARGAKLFNALVYGPHPFGRPALGTRETVARLTAADCQAFHRVAFAPNTTTVVVVGDFRTADLIAAIEKLTRNWPPTDRPVPEVPAPPRPTAPVERIVSDPAAAQVHVYIGHLGITRDNPDYYKLLVMDNILGVGAGFTYRLSAVLRDRQGLAYTVYASITETAGKQPGTFNGYIGTFPDKYLDVRHGFLREIENLREHAPTPQEVEDAKSYLLGSLPFRFATFSGVAEQLQAAQRYGLGFDFVEKFRREIAAVTPADVRAVARQYLDPRKLTIVAVGPIDAEGRPLRNK